MKWAWIISSCFALFGCSNTAPSGNFRYLGVKTQLLDGDLVGFRVLMEGARRDDDVVRYARCAAAQYALIRDHGFARHIRTLIERKGDVWIADAVYTISTSIPRGIRTIDAEVTVAECGALGIPTV